MVDHLKCSSIGIESFHKTIDKAQPGDQLGILLRGLDSKDVRRGDVLLLAGSKHFATDRAIAQVYILTG